MSSRSRFRGSVLGRHADRAAATGSGTVQAPAGVIRERSGVREITGDAGPAAIFADGDAEAVRAVYQRYGQLVFAAAFEVLGDIGLAQDATQQTFVRAWAAASHFDGIRALGPWLAAIARRAAIDVLRREQRVLDVAGPAVATVPPSQDQTSTLWQVRSALQQLTEADRELIRLQHDRGLTHVEIARYLLIPLGTVVSRSHRAHQRLAQPIADARTDQRKDGQDETVRIPRQGHQHPIGQRDAFLMEFDR